MKKKLVIVESPAKTRTLSKLLNKEFDFKASLGHVRDLPKSRLGVDIENDFHPKYVIPRQKTKLVNELKRAVKNASVVYLATDPDREGEAIAWHLKELTKTNHIPYHRVTFREITKGAIEQAFKHPHKVNQQLVNAQQARRILDRLVGYKLSPLLWQKVRKGLSAGRVQSVTLNIIVNREREIQEFRPQEYWTINLLLAKKNTTDIFTATLIGFFDGAKITIDTKEKADEIRFELEHGNFSVTKVKTKKIRRQPPPPFITSTLQQESWRKLHFNARQTMIIAQQLYEGLPIGDEGSVGLITYMRTDSTRMSRSSINETRQFINEKYGTQYLPPHARTFIRSSRWQQEAHEAIRPTMIYREPSSVKTYLTTEQFRLYELIWKRTVASQMTSALFNQTLIDCKAQCPVNDYLCRATSSVRQFPGFMMLYTEGKDTSLKDEPSAKLPLLQKGDKLQLDKISTEQHFTQPPPRFTEATLIKFLEQFGIGRPSTYAPILSTIQERNYVTRLGSTLQPTELGKVVNDLLIKHFSDIINIEFTAQLEGELDEIANKNRDWVETIRHFYVPFEADLTKATQIQERVTLADEITEEICPKCQRHMIVKYGRYGRFIACSGYPDCKFTKPYQVRIGISCPLCKGDLVEKMNRKKRIFYGCNNYPECNFATNQKPLDYPCPQCNGLLVNYRKKWAKCINCDYKDEVKIKILTNVGSRT